MRFAVHNMLLLLIIYVSLCVRIVSVSGFVIDSAYMCVSENQLQQNT